MELSALGTYVLLLQSVAVFFLAVLTVCCIKCQRRLSKAVEIKQSTEDGEVITVQELNFEPQKPSMSERDMGNPDHLVPPQPAEIIDSQKESTEDFVELNSAVGDTDEDIHVFAEIRKNSLLSGLEKVKSQTGKFRQFLLPKAARKHKKKKKRHKKTSKDGETDANEIGEGQNIKWKDRKKYKDKHCAPAVEVVKLPCSEGDMILKIEDNDNRNVLYGYTGDSDKILVKDATTSNGSLIDSSMSLDECFNPALGDNSHATSTFSIISDREKIVGKLLEKDVSASAESLTVPICDTVCEDFNPPYTEEEIHNWEMNACDAELLSVFNSSHLEIYPSKMESGSDQKFQNTMDKGKTVEVTETIDAVHQRYDEKTPMFREFPGADGDEEEHRLEEQSSFKVVKSPGNPQNHESQYPKIAKTSPLVEIMDFKSLLEIARSKESAETEERHGISAGNFSTQYPFTPKFTTASVDDQSNADYARKDDLTSVLKQKRGKSSPLLKTYDKVFHSSRQDTPKPIYPYRRNQGGFGELQKNENGTNHLQPIEIGRDKGRLSPVYLDITARAHSVSPIHENSLKDHVGNNKKEHVGKSKDTAYAESPDHEELPKLHNTSSRDTATNGKLQERKVGERWSSQGDNYCYSQSVRDKIMSFAERALLANANHALSGNSQMKIKELGPCDLQSPARTNNAVTESIEKVVSSCNHCSDQETVSSSDLSEGNNSIDKYASKLSNSGSQYSNSKPEVSATLDSVLCKIGHESYIKAMASPEEISSINSFIDDDRFDSIRACPQDDQTDIAVDGDGDKYDEDIIPLEDMNDDYNLPTIREDESACFVERFEYDETWGAEDSENDDVYGDETYFEKGINVNINNPLYCDRLAIQCESSHSDAYASCMKMTDFFVNKVSPKLTKSGIQGAEMSDATSVKVSDRNDNFEITLDYNQHCSNAISSVHLTEFGDQEIRPFTRKVTMSTSRSTESENKENNGYDTPTSDDLVVKELSPHEINEIVVLKSSASKSSISHSIKLGSAKAMVRKHGDGSDIDTDTVISVEITQSMPEDMLDDESSFVRPNSDTPRLGSASMFKGNTESADKGQFHVQQTVESVFCSSNNLVCDRERYVADQSYWPSAELQEGSLTLKKISDSSPGTTSTKITSEVLVSNEQREWLGSVSASLFRQNSFSTGLRQSQHDNHQQQKSPTISLTTSSSHYSDVGSPFWKPVPSTKQELRSYQRPTIGDSPTNDQSKNTPVNAETSAGSMGGKNVHFATKCDERPNRSFNDKPFPSPSPLENDGSEDTGVDSQKSKLFHNAAGIKNHSNRCDIGSCLITPVKATDNVLIERLIGTLSSSQQQIPPSVDYKCVTYHLPRSDNSYKAPSAESRSPTNIYTQFPKFGEETKPRFTGNKHFMTDLSSTQVLSPTERFTSLSKLGSCPSMNFSPENDISESSFILDSSLAKSSLQSRAFQQKPPSQVNSQSRSVQMYSDRVESPDDVNLRTHSPAGLESSKSKSNPSNNSADDDYRQSGSYITKSATSVPSKTSQDRTATDTVQNMAQQFHTSTKKNYEIISMSERGVARGQSGNYKQIHTNKSEGRGPATPQIELCRHENIKAEKKMCSKKFDSSRSQERYANEIENKPLIFAFPPASINQNPSEERQISIQSKSADDYCYKNDKTNDVKVRKQYFLSERNLGHAYQTGGSAKVCTTRVHQNEPVNKGRGQEQTAKVSSIVFDHCNPINESPLHLMASNDGEQTLGYFERYRNNLPSIRNFLSSMIRSKASTLDQSETDRVSVENVLAHEQIGRRQPEKSKPILTRSGCHPPASNHEKHGENIIQVQFNKSPCDIKTNVNPVHLRDLSDHQFDESAGSDIHCVNPYGGGSITEKGSCCLNETKLQSSSPAFEEIQPVGSENNLSPSVNPSEWCEAETQSKSLMRQAKGSEDSVLYNYPQNERTLRMLQVNRSPPRMPMQVNTSESRIETNKTDQILEDSVRKDHEWDIGKIRESGRLKAIKRYFARLKKMHTPGPDTAVSMSLNPKTEYIKQFKNLRNVSPQSHNPAQVTSAYPLRAHQPMNLRQHRQNFKFSKLMSDNERSSFSRKTCINVKSTSSSKKTGHERHQKDEKNEMLFTPPKRTNFNYLTGNNDHSHGRVAHQRNSFKSGQRSGDNSESQVLRTPVSQTVERKHQASNCQTTNDTEDHRSDLMHSRSNKVSISMQNYKFIDESAIGSGLVDPEECMPTAKEKKNFSESVSPPRKVRRQSKGKDNRTVYAKAKSGFVVLQRECSPSESHHSSSPLKKKQRIDSKSHESERKWASMARSPLKVCQPFPPRKDPNRNMSHVEGSQFSCPHVDDMVDISGEYINYSSSNVPPFDASETDSEVQGYLADRNVDVSGPEEFFTRRKPGSPRMSLQIDSCGSERMTPNSLHMSFKGKTRKS